MTALLDAPLDIAFNRAQTSRRRMAPGAEQPAEPTTERPVYHARMAVREGCQLARRWYVIEIDSDEDWQYAAAEIYYPPPPDRPFELWATFEGHTFLIYPSDDDLAKRFLAIKLARWEPDVEDEEVEVDHGQG